MAWLPPAPPGPDLGSLPPWEPAGVRERLGAGAPWDALSYIVVDELHEGVAGLVVNTWPRVDSVGRLVFGGEEESRRIATSADALLAALRRRRLPVVPVPVDERTEEELRRRELSIGDVFAARIAGDPGEDPGSWLHEPVLDITAVAREAAKTQASAAALGVIDEDLIVAIGEEIGEDEQPQEPG
jgi:hypothetical protein